MDQPPKTKEGQETSLCGQRLFGDTVVIEAGEKRGYVQKNGRVDNNLRPNDQCHVIRQNRTPGVG